MGDLFEKLKGVSWPSIIKALPFDGGPSSTRWVFLGVFAVISFGTLAIDAVICWVYVKHHTADSTLCNATIAVKTALLGFGAAVQNGKNKTDAAAGAAPVKD